MILIPHEGARYLLSLLLRDTVSSGLVFTQRLFKNNFTPTRDSVRGNFTDATFAGYAPVDLARSQWSAPADSGIAALSVYGSAPMTFLATSGTQDIYGSFVTNDADDTVLWAELFPQKITVSTAVGVPVIPLLTLWSA